MKFTQRLNAHLTPEWRRQYISYADLKSMILEAAEKAPLQQISTSRIIEKYYANFEEDFFYECDKELKKIDNFYAEKIAEATRHYECLSLALSQIMNDFHFRSTTRQSLRQDEVKKLLAKKKIKVVDLKNGFSELYLSLVLLQNYKVLNHTGFKKILKKHDKFFNNTKGSKWFEEKVSSAYFYQDTNLNSLMHDVESNFTKYLENGDRAEAMKRLRVPPLEEIQEVETVFRVGLFLAFFGYLKSNSQSVNYHNLILFRAPFYVIMYLFLLGINVFCWRRAGVNHILIFEINPRKHLTYTHLMELHAVFGFLWSLCVLGYLYNDRINVPKLLFPLLLVGIMLAFLFNPFPILYRNPRLWLLKVMGRVIMAPFFNVAFADFWLGDQLNSMVACLLDFKYLLCFYIFNISWREEFQSNECLENDYIGNAIVRCLPSWFRFAQCLRRYRDTGQAFPFLVNAGKYATTFPMVIFLTLTLKYNDNFEYAFQNHFLWFYLVSAIFNACYCCCYDILRDFRLFQTFTGKNIFLRTHIVYHPRFYYFAIVENIILRFFWAISFYVVTQNYVNKNNMETLAGCLEMFRRYIWNYLRLENEHLFNVGQFRAVRDIFITPIETLNTIEIQKMMDEEDGVVNRAGYDFKKLSVTDEEEDFIKE